MKLDDQRVLAVLEGRNKCNGCGGIGYFNWIKRCGTPSTTSGKSNETCIRCLGLGFVRTMHEMRALKQRYIRLSKLYGYAGIPWDAWKDVI